MNAKGLLSIFAIVLLLSVANGSASAQQPTPEAGAVASRYLPSPDALGAGWIMQPAVGVSGLSTDVFREAAAGYYGGPNGARAVVIVLIATDARIAVRQAWEDASDIYDHYRYRMGGGDYERQQELETIPPPAACQEVKRVEGTDTDYGFSNAVTMCAGNANEIIIAVVSGGQAASQRYEASDALAVMALNVGTGGASGTPNS